MPHYSVHVSAQNRSNPSSKVRMRSQAFLALTLIHCVFGYVEECSNYKFLNESNRAQTYNKSSPLICDSALSGWYRFSGEAGNQMPQSCVKKLHCGTHAPGWLNGSHPTVADGAVKRRVCFHWSDNCCRWSITIDVRNCGGFYVYKLERPPACTLRYCGNGLPNAPECSNYNDLNEGDRAVGNSDQSSVKCDRSIKEGWYRFRGDAGNEMPTTCPPKQRCGTHAPGWLNGEHPTVADGAVQRQVCYHWSSGCCQWKNDIHVRNCGGFYVYKLKAPPACSLRYCGNRQAPSPHSECSNYKILSEANRAQSYNKPSPLICDSALSGWYRFSGEAGSQMQESCVKERHCGTHAPGWLVGGHPTVAGGLVKRKVCFNWSGNCCRWSLMIDVRNCSGFYVYKLERPPACTLRYCGNGLPNAPECSNYNYLDEGDRAIGNSDQSAVKCDRSEIKDEWYRFRGDAGDEMPTTCPPKRRCGTHAPGWLNGKNPTVAEGVVQRQVCYHWSSGCCQWKNYIHVRNCGGFYVYKLTAPPACSLRYCGNRQAPPPSTPAPTTLRPTPTSYSECSNYNILAEGDRAVGNSDQSNVKCDRSEIKDEWYRFRGDAGNEMPTTCPPKLRCGTHAPGWLVGHHPTVAEGVVQRQVCYHWSSGCCQWKNYIHVRNCGGFYVYKLTAPPACSLRYCGSRQVPTPTRKPTVHPTPTAPNHGFMILCLPTSMMVNISRKSLSMEPSLLHLNDPGCGAVRVDRKYVVMETPLDGCGTVQRSIGKNVQQFYNKVVVPSGYGRKRSYLEFPFMCTYNKFGIPGWRGRRGVAPLHKRGYVMDSTSDDTTTDA